MFQATRLFSISFSIVFFSVVLFGGRGILQHILANSANFYGKSIFLRKLIFTVEQHPEIIQFEVYKKNFLLEFYSTYCKCAFSQLFDIFCRTGIEFQNCRFSLVFIFYLYPGKFWVLQNTNTHRVLLRPLPSNYVLYTL